MRDLLVVAARLGQVGIWLLKKHRSGIQAASAAGIGNRLMCSAALAAEMTMRCSTRALRSSDLCGDDGVWGGRRIFQHDANAHLLIATLYRYRAVNRFLLHGFVVMPDHVHLLFSPAAALEQAVGLIKGGFSFAVREQFRGLVWQDGYYVHRVMSEQDYHGQLAYIAANPARRRLEEYPFVHTALGYEVDLMPQHLGTARL